MIEINLLPEELKKKQARITKIDMSRFNVRNLPIIPIVGGILGGVIAIQILLFLITLYSKTNHASLNKKYEIILPNKKEADALNRQADMINKKAAAIDELMVKRFSWAKKLSDLNMSITSDVWLTELSYDEKAVERPAPAKPQSPKGKGENIPQAPAMERVVLKYLIISGYAPSRGEEGTASIGKFIKSLKTNPYFYSDFSDIELGGSIKRDRIQDEEVMSFKITCLFK